MQASEAQRLDVRHPIRASCRVAPILAQQAGGRGGEGEDPIADTVRMWARGVWEVAWMAARQYWGAGRARCA